MFGFGKKKEKKVIADNVTEADVKAAEKDLGMDKMPSGMKFLFVTSFQMPSVERNHVFQNADGAKLLSSNLILTDISSY